MPLFIKDAIGKLENLIPLSLQEKWDNSGFQIKQADAPLSGVLTSLDISDKCIDLAISRSLNLILTHHPVFFHPLRSMDLDSKSGNILRILIKNNICVYSMHTNFDSSVHSMSRFMINKLGIKESFPLIPRKRKLYKLSVFIPKGYVKTVRDVLFAYGNPKIGNYEDCSFEMRGKGSFKPLPGSNPFVGSCMKTSFVDESKLEILIDEKFIKEAVSEMKKVHPYEEIAYNLYPISDFGGSSSEGMGAVGDFENGMSLSVLLEKMRALFSPIFINYCGDLNRKIKRVAIVSGSGFSFTDEAVKSGSDVIISSELTHDKAIKANNSGICVIELSHFDTERYFSGIVKEILSNELDVPVIENVYENNPFFKYKI